MKSLSIFTLLGLTATLVSVEASPANESAQLDVLYEAAKDEGGQLNLFFGGDEKDQWDGYVSQFNERFPEINVTWKVDVSKYHDMVVDRNLNLTGKAGVDAVFLQTLHDFDRWKEEGKLLQYYPVGYDQVHGAAKDQDGYWIGILYYVFSSTYNPSLIGTAGSPPVSFEDYLDNADSLKGQFALTYPNDDDAIAFMFYKLLNKYGWAEILDFINRADIQWVRGSETPTTLMARNESIVASFSTTGASNVGLETVFSNDSITITWPQTGGIFKTAEHPQAAKLFVSWALSPEAQAAASRWPIRHDLPTRSGITPLNEYTNFSPTEFREFMRDRTLVETLKLQFESIIGTAQGVSPLEDDIF